MSSNLSVPGVIRTYSGRSVNILQPSADQVDLRDIAHALANECRFSGHTTRHYSVAEHCLHGLQFIDPADVEFRVAWLLHDMSEAYLKDMPKPLKLLPEFAFYLELEARWSAAIAEHFGVRMLCGLPEVYRKVERLDKRMLVTEQQQLMHRAPQTDDAARPLALRIPDEYRAADVVFREEVRNAIAALQRARRGDGMSGVFAAHPSLVGAVVKSANYIVGEGLAAPRITEAVDARG